MSLADSYDNIEMKSAFVASVFFQRAYELEMVKYSTLNSAVLALSFIPPHRELRLWFQSTASSGECAVKKSRHTHVFFWFE